MFDTLARIFGLKPRREPKRHTTFFIPRDGIPEAGWSVEHDRKWAILIASEHKAKIRSVNTFVGEGRLLIDVEAANGARKSFWLDYEAVHVSLDQRSEFMRFVEENHNPPRPKAACRPMIAPSASNSQRRVDTSW